MSVPLQHLGDRDSSFDPFFPSLSWTLHVVWGSPLTPCQTLWCNLYSQTAL